MMHTKKHKEKQLIEAALEETWTLHLQEKDFRSPVTLLRAIAENLSQKIKNMRIMSHQIKSISKEKEKWKESNKNSGIEI